MANVRSILRALNQTYEKVDRSDLDLQHDRIVVFSDHHRGQRDGADDFVRSEAAYRAALGYYLSAGYSLFLLGDVEELWECRAKKVIRAYKETLELEAKFFVEDRLRRFYGNHDDQWESVRSVRKHLWKLFPKLQVREGLRMKVLNGQVEIGEIFFLHGHQGTGFSHRLKGLSKPVLRHVWRPFQRLTHVRLNTPATCFADRSEHAKAFEEWVEAHPRVLLIAGHTHQPVFGPAPKTEELLQRLEELQESNATDEHIAEASSDVEYMRAREDYNTPYNRGKLRYFNTGCCSYDDGDCTGLEIVDGKIRLVHWPGDETRPRRTIYREATIRSLLTKPLATDGTDEAQEIPVYDERVPVDRRKATAS